jgi:hypothetical protein
LSDCKPGVEALIQRRDILRALLRTVGDKAHTDWQKTSVIIILSRFLAQGDSHRKYFLVEFSGNNLFGNIAKILRCDASKPYLVMECLIFLYHLIGYHAGAPQCEVDSLLASFEQREVFNAVLEAFFNRKYDGEIEDSIINIFWGFFKISDDDVLYGWLTKNLEFFSLIVGQLDVKKPACAIRIYLLMINKVLWLGEITRECVTKNGTITKMPNYFMDVIRKDPALTLCFEEIQGHNDQNVYDLSA